jgi:hypothetical protein
MATVVASGLFIGTFMTPIVVPLAYTILDDLRVWGRRVAARARGGQPRQGLPEPVATASEGVAAL